jgi:hypothetical protein
MNNNPFNINSPVDETQFFGRKLFVATLEEHLDSDPPGSAVVFGLPGSGKTSLLHHISTWLPKQTYLPIFLPFKDKANLAVEQLLHSLSQIIANEAQLDSSPVTTFDGFFEDFLPQVCRQIAPRCLVLLLDDVEAGFDRAGLSDFLSRLALLVANEQKIAVVISSAAHLQNMPDPFTPVELPKLAPHETQTLIMQLSQNTPVRFSDRAVEAIIRLSAGHPFFIQVLAHECFEYATTHHLASIEVEVINAVLPRVLNHSDRVLKPLVMRLTENTQTTLVACAQVANYSKFITPKTIYDMLRRHRIKFNEQQLNRHLDELQQHNLLKKEVQGVYTFDTPITTLWVLSRFPFQAGGAHFLLSGRNLAIATFLVGLAGALFLGFWLLAPDTATPTPTTVAKAPPIATPQPEIFLPPTETPGPPATATPRPAETPTPSPTATPQPTETLTPLPSPTLEPTLTPTNPPPTPTPSPAPTDTPLPVVSTALPEPTAGPQPTAAQAVAPLPSGLQFLGLEVAENGFIYAVAKDKGIYQRSRDGVWSLFTADLNDAARIRSLGVGAGGNTLYAGYNDGVRRWSAAEGWSGKSAFPRFHNFVAVPGSSLVFAASDVGVYRSLDDGRTWQAVNIGLNGRIIEVAILSLALGHNAAGAWTLYAAGDDSAVIFKTTVDPEREATIQANQPRWQDVICQCDAQKTIFAVATDPTNDQIIYAGNDRSRMSLSADGGATWQTTIVPVGAAQEVFITDIEVAPGNGVAYAATGSDPAPYASNGILIRTGPNNWVAGQPFGFKQGQDYVSNIALDPINANIVYVASSRGLFKYDNSAPGWQESP